MKSVSFLIASALLVTASLYAQDAPPITAAVLDFDVSGEKYDGLGSDSAKLLTAKLSANPALMLVERAEIEKLLGEIELGKGGAVGPNPAKAGEMLGAQVLVTGRIFQAGGKFFLVAKVIGVETSRVFGESTTFAELGGLDGATDQLAEKIAALIGKQRDAFVPKVETEVEFVARLKKMVGDKPLPVLAIILPEQHLARPVVDPAAKTEIARFYELLGGKVVEDSAAADVVIQGEAFSERATQRGNMISCRARIEITIARKGTVFLHDRQTSAAIGLGEHVTAKEALEIGGRRLLERDLTKIVGQ